MALTPKRNHAVVVICLAGSIVVYGCLLVGHLGYSTSFPGRAAVDFFSSYASHKSGKVSSPASFGILDHIHRFKMADLFIV